MLEREILIKLQTKETATLPCPALRRCQEAPAQRCKRGSLHKRRLPPHGRGPRIDYLAIELIAPCTTPFGVPGPTQGRGKGGGGEVCSLNKIYWTQLLAAHACLQLSTGTATHGFLRTPTAMWLLADILHQEGVSDIKQLVEHWLNVVLCQATRRAW